MDNQDFTNSINVLTEFAEYVAEAYKKKLITGGNVNTGALISSINVNAPSININGQTFEVSLSLNRYYEYLEGGISPSGKYRNPGFRAFPHILEWIRTKPVSPRPGKRGKLPSEKQLAYLITRSISRKGIRPKPYMQMSVDEAISAFNDRIEEAFSKDVRDMVVMKINDMVRLTNHPSE